MIRFPNRTAQEGVFREGTPNYIELSLGSALPGMARFLTRATAESWSDGDTLGVLLKKSTGDYQVWTGSWDSVSETIDCDTMEDSDGTFTDGDPVFVIATMTRGSMESLYNDIVNRVIPG